LAAPKRRSTFALSASPKGTKSSLVHNSPTLSFGKPGREEISQATRKNAPKIRGSKTFLITTLLP
jgi:hypothetical protein